MHTYYDKLNECNSMQQQKLFLTKDSTNLLCFKFKGDLQ